MKRLTSLTILLLVCGLLVRSQASETLTALQIADKAYHSEDGEDASSLIAMRIITARGNEKTRYFSFGRKDDGEDSRSLIVFTQPADIKGTAFLTWTHARADNDQWLYLPALKRVKRIGTASQSDSFMGSDFSYEDMSKRSTSKDTFRILGRETVDSADCHVLEARAVNQSEAFVKRILWIRSDLFLIVKAEFYDAEGALIKRYTAGDIRTVQGIATIHSFRMDDLKKGGHSTMTVSQARYNSGLPDRLFSVQGLKRD